MELDMGRILSVAIAVVGLVICSWSALSRGGKEAQQLPSLLITISLAFLFCLVLIWFGDALGDYIPRTRYPAHVYRKSPGWLVKAFGWLFLLVIVGVMLYGFVTGLP
jgi:uncharacterized membrane protein YoaT (DUF817 family)